MAWKEYQKDAASFFLSLGFDAEIEKTIAGVRGNHNIDVWVTGEVYGISLKWAVECKLWKTNIPKEKAKAFHSRRKIPINRRNPMRPKMIPLAPI